MTKNTRYIVGILFFIIATIAVTIIRISPDNVTPIQSTESKQAGILLGLGRGTALTQEITAAKNYLTGVSLVFTQGGRNNTNQNTLLVLDPSYKILSRLVFSSSTLKEGDYDVFSFKEPIFIGKGNKFFLSLMSLDGAEDNAASPLMNMKDSIGRFITTVIDPNDIAGSLKKDQTLYKGSLMLKTFETDQSQLWLVKISLYLLILVIAALVIWSDKLTGFLAGTRLRPEYGFAAIALVFSLIFAYITPPFQVPDEGTHYKLSYSASELGFLKNPKTYPLSIATMDSAFMNMHFLAGAKITPDIIKGRFAVKAEPEKRAPMIATDYALPYIPQGIGIATGKIFSSSLLTQMYFGRLFNLLIAILIMFFAIRLIPEPFRLLYLLLALMPKTIFLFGSLSYDSFTISLSFFAIALFLHYAFDHEKQLTIRELAYMALVVVLLLLCKPPYFLIGALFFTIPPKKFGKLYKFIWIAIGVGVIGIFILKVVPMMNNYKNQQSQSSYSNSAPAMQAGDVKAFDSVQRNEPLFKPDVQIRAIVNDVPAYLKMIFNSGFDYYRTYIVKSFIGVLGYIDVELPDMLTYSYLFLILLTAVVISQGRLRIGISRKALFAVLLVLTFIIIETAMWLYATRPGRDRVFGVQGRYFIPMAPLFYMLFYNQFLNLKLNLLFSHRKNEYKSAKPKAKPAVLEDIQLNERLFDKYLYLSLLLYCTFALSYSVYLTMIRYYI